VSRRRISLRPLTEEQRNRMIEMLASGPLTERPVDAELIRLGWLERYDDTAAFWPVDGATAAFYNPDGTINALWIP